MFEDKILIPARRIPWLKIGFIGMGVTFATGFAVYSLTSKMAFINNQVELIQKDLSRLNLEEQYRARKVAEQKECDKQRISLWGKEGCFKEYK